MFANTVWSVIKLKMGSISTKWVVIHNKYHVYSGMATYAILWTSSSLTQQAISRKEKINYKQALRYGIYGCFISAPMFNIWINFTNKLYPSATLESAIKKAFLGQMTYAPVIISAFFIGMTLLEGKSFNTALAEVQNKFLSAYTVGMCVWPLAQTINYMFVPQRNQVLFVGFISFMYAVFLAFLKQMSVITSSEQNLEEPTNTT